jgi:hypothetical protein
MAHEVRVELTAAPGDQGTEVRIELIRTAGSDTMPRH